MNLTKEQQEIYDGKQGATLAKVMQTLVRYGELSEQALEKSLEILEKAPAESCLFPRPPV